MKPPCPLEAVAPIKVVLRPSMTLGERGAAGCLLYASAPELRNHAIITNL